MDMAIELTSDEMIKEIIRVKGKRSNRAVALEMGVSEQYVCDLLRGRRDVSVRMAAALGFQRLMKFRKAPVAQKDRATHS
jgi:plasmid maintenance system antidote protein VapI